MRKLIFLVCLLPTFVFGGSLDRSLASYKAPATLYLQDDLRSPFHLMVDDKAVNGCWTNSSEVRKVLWEPLSELGIETARATYNYLHLQVEGSRINGSCFGTVTVQILVDAEPLTAEFSTFNPPELLAVVAQKTKLAVDPANLNSKTMDVVQKFMSEFRDFMELK